jgi:hypothetical protein
MYGVISRFTRNAIRLENEIERLDGAVGVAAEFARNELIDSDGQALQRGRQASLKLRRVKALGNVANLHHRLVDQAGQIVQLPCVPGSFPVEIRRQRLYGERGAENVLREMVVHFPANPPLLPAASRNACSRNSNS